MQLSSKLNENTGSPRLPAEPDGSERRTEVRYPAHDAAELELLSTPGQTMHGIILDVSRSGLRFALPRRINRGEQVKIKLQENFIYGEVRYCRAVSGAYHAGILIQELVRPPNPVQAHIEEDPLMLYAIGKGLSVAEIINIREHLVRCDACRARLTEKEALLNPSRRSRLRRALT